MIKNIRHQHVQGLKGLNYLLGGISSGGCWGSENLLFSSRMCALHFLFLRPLIYNDESHKSLTKRQIEREWVQQCVRRAMQRKQINLCAHPPLSGRLGDQEATWANPLRVSPRALAQTNRDPIPCVTSLALIPHFLTIACISLLFCCRSEHCFPRRPRRRPLYCVRMWKLFFFFLIYIQDVISHKRGVRKTVELLLARHCSQLFHPCNHTQTCSS